MPGHDPPNDQHSAYRLAAQDEEFLLGDSMRGVRFLLEYAKAEERLRSWGVASTIVVFGSARVLQGGSSDPAATTATMPEGARPRRGATSARWYEEARRFGRIASERGGALRPVEGLRRNVVATGGGPGIMEAANRGAYDVGAPTIGFNIRLPLEQVPNAFTTPDLTFQFHYFAMRKMHLAMRAAALVVFPGGFGTFDELFEVLTLRQTEKAAKVPIVLFDPGYWRRVVNFEALVEEGMIEEEDLGLFDFADDAEEAWSCLIRRGLLAGEAEPAPGS
ncbi:TIGR00730 family Rossman fold protein [Enterovirga sp.]|uniref:LOG family protein n=1 Tax=Enterovirga sp. TaxID=2026350 RepID=UPI002601811D|nr:TIGR00730 family Rossman fold protein [Enterovirga sp.]